MLVQKKYGNKTLGYYEPTPKIIYARNTNSCKQHELKKDMDPSINRLHKWIAQNFCSSKKAVDGIIRETNYEKVETSSTRFQ